MCTGGIEFGSRRCAAVRVTAAAENRPEMPPNPTGAQRVGARDGQLLRTYSGQVRHHSAREREAAGEGTAVSVRARQVRRVGGSCDRADIVLIRKLCAACDDCCRICERGD